MYCTADLCWRIKTLRANNDHDDKLTNIDGPVLITVSLELDEITRSKEGEEEGCVRPGGVAC